MRASKIIVLGGVSLAAAASNYLHLNPTPAVTKILGLIPSSDDGFVAVAIRGEAKKQLGVLVSKDGVSYAETFKRIESDNLGEEGYEFIGGAVDVDGESMGQDNALYALAREPSKGAPNNVYKCKINGAKVDCAKASLTPLFEDVPSKFTDLSLLRVNTGTNKSQLVLILITADCKCSAYRATKSGALSEAGKFTLAKGSDCEGLAIAQPHGSGRADVVMLLSRGGRTEAIPGDIKLNDSGDAVWTAGAVKSRDVIVGGTGIGLGRFNSTNVPIIAGIFGGSDSNVAQGIMLTRELKVMEDVAGVAAPKKVSQWQLPSWHDWKEAIAPLAGKKIPSKECGTSEITAKDEKRAFVFDYTFEGDFSGVNAVNWHFISDGKDDLLLTLTGEELLVTFNEKLLESLTLTLPPIQADKRHVVLALDSTVTEVFIDGGVKGTSVTIPHPLKGAWVQSCLMQTGAGIAVGKGAKIRRFVKPEQDSIDAAALSVSTTAATFISIFALIGASLL